MADLTRFDTAISNEAQSAFELQNLYGTISQSFIDMANMKRTLEGSFDTPETIMAAQLGNLGAQAAKQGIAAAAGFSPDMSIDIRAKLLSVAKDSALKVNELTAKLAEDKSVSLFDNPMLALMNAFTIPWTEEALQGQIAKRDQAYSSAEKLSVGVTQAAQAEESIKTKLTMAAIQDQRAALEGNLAAKRLADTNYAISNQISSVKAVQEASRQQLAIYNAQTAEIRADENAAIMRQQRDLAIEEHKLKLEQLGDAAAAEKETLRLANLALQRDGLPQINSTEGLRRKLLTAKDKQYYEDLVNKGRELDTPSLAPHYRHGDTVEETVNYWSKSGYRSKNAAQDNMMQLVKEAASVAQRKEKKPGSAAEWTAEEWLKDKIRNNIEVVKFGDDTNPNKAVTIGTLLTKSDIANDPVFREAILPFVTEGNKHLSAHPEVIFPMIVTAVEKGKVKPIQAAKLLKGIYDYSIAVNNVDNDSYKILGRDVGDFRTSVKIGPNIGLSIASDAALVTGAGLAASGAGAIPGAAIAGLGLAAEAYNLTANKSSVISWKDETQILKVMQEKIKADLGYTLGADRYASPGFLRTFGQAITGN